MNMFGQKTIGNAAVAILLVLMIGSARADVFNMSGGTTSLEFITVANPGNAGQLAIGTSDLPYAWPPSRVCGEVDYVYSIGKYEVTAGQYCEFLNAVAKTDTHGLYNPYMDLSAHPSTKGCNIIRTGTSGNYSYSVALDWANRPVNYVSIYDAGRFVNWLTNGQPTGNQDITTTEAGSYYPWDLHNRNANAKYVLSSEDEWYKAAYYDPNKPGGAGYWKYATKSDTVVPSNILSSTGVNNANYASTSLPYGSSGSVCRFPKRIRHF
jgi:sulfatase modifying factor 1